MKLQNNVINRVGVSLAIAFIAMLILNLITPSFGFSILEVVVSTVLVYIPVTIIWAIISTVKAAKPEEDSEDILDS